MDIEYIKDDRSQESNDPIIGCMNKLIKKIIIDKELPDSYYDKIIDVNQRGFATMAAGYEYPIIGTSSLGPCTSLVLYDNISKTIAVTHVDAYAFLTKNDILEEGKQNSIYEDRLKMEAEIKDIVLSSDFSPIEYNYQNIIAKHNCIYGE